MVKPACILFNGKYYFYKQNKFEEAFIEEYDIYVTAYKGECGTVVINSPKKCEHDKLCLKIENDGEEVFNDVLLKMYEKNPKIKEKYPHLVKKI